MTGNRKIFYVVLAGITVLAGFGVVNLSRRAVFPYKLEQTSAGLQITAMGRPGAPTNPIGKILSRLDSFPIKHPEQIQTLLEQKISGDVVLLEFSNGDTLPVTLPARSGVWFILVSGILGAAFFIISLIVWRQSKETGEKYFALSAMMFGYIIAMGGTGFCLPAIISIPLNILYFLSYPQAFLLFLYFSYFFPSQVLPDDRLQIRKRLLQIGGILLSGTLLVAFFLKTVHPTVHNVLLYDVIYRTFRGVILLLLFLSFTVLLKNLRQEPNPENYRKVYWLVWGVIFGSVPFILFWNLPQLLGYPPLLPEWLVTLWLLIIPVSIAIAIIKYRLFDIEIILSRSIVYFTVIAVLLVLYVLLVGGLSLAVYRQFSLQTPLFSLLTVLVIALAFNPLKAQVTQLVNRKFFRIRYDRFLALKGFMNNLENCYTTEQVFESLRQHYHSVVPLRHSFFGVAEGEAWRWVQLPETQVKPWQDWLKQHVSHPFPTMMVNETCKHLVENFPGQTVSPLPADGVMVVPVGAAALWFLGKKLSGARFWREDVELAEQMAHAAAIQLEKVKYFQKAAQEALEKKQAQRLSRWKSLLVAEVAHDLRSPLNTMLWKLKNFQLMLQEQGERLQPVEEIRRQIEHLQGLIQALLIMPQVEEGKYRIQWQTLSVKETIEAVLAHLEGIITGKQLEVRVECPADLVLRADQTLLNEVLLNLLDNAAKFSSPGQQIVIKAGADRQADTEKTYITIIDEAGGIPPEKQRLLFEPFEEQENGGGRIHLGLYIAREFTRAMGGELKLKSEMGKGTEVELCFER